MTFIVTHDETGRRFTFPSELVYESALDWYNATSKADLISWWIEYDNRPGRAMTGEIWADPDGTELAPDWAEIIMEAWARDQTGRTG